MSPGEIHKVAAAQQQSQRGNLSCYWCGRKGHTAAKCQFKNSECPLCEKVGHLKAICRSKKAKPPSNQSQQDRQHSVQQVQDQESTYPLFTLQSSGRKPWLVTVEVDEQSLTMEIDVGTSISLVSAATYKCLWPLRKLQEAQVKVCTQMSLLWSCITKTNVPSSHSLWPNVMGQVCLVETGYSAYAWIGVRFTVLARATWRRCWIRKKHCSSQG